MALAEQLKQAALRPHINETTVKLATCDGFEVRIRRITVAQRDAIYGKYTNIKTDLTQAAQAGKEACCACLDGLTVADLSDLPGAVVDELVTVISRFNGWDKEGRVDAQAKFRDAGGAEVPAVPGA